MKRVGMAMAALLAAVVLGASPAFAQDPIHKLGRGASNVVTCWIEIPKNFHLGMQETNPVTGMFGGLLKGFGMAATRLVIGAYEVVTFPIPVPGSYASPYEGMELQDYAWE
ncbi:MAG: exosortase system-associated protein, TIGR04073 family [Candidatus Omnitrophica bacterium]|nr:exosortase system-associated protein, TIGR04073 family [Candidatus Omnitrophota bacterium]